MLPEQPELDGLAEGDLQPLVGGHLELLVLEVEGDAGGRAADEGAGGGEQDCDDCKGESSIQISAASLACKTPPRSRPGRSPERCRRGPSERPRGLKAP